MANAALMEKVVDANAGRELGLTSERMVRLIRGLAASGGDRETTYCPVCFARLAERCTSCIYRHVDLTFDLHPTTQAMMLTIRQGGDASVSDFLTADETGRGTNNNLRRHWIQKRFSATQFCFTCSMPWFGSDTPSTAWHASRGIGSGAAGKCRIRGVMIPFCVAMWVHQREWVVNIASQAGERELQDFRQYWTWLAQPFAMTTVCSVTCPPWYAKMFARWNQRVDGEVPGPDY